MALQMRPSCEHCTTPLPADRDGAYICSYECTFCATCAIEVLGTVCPNCTGWLVPRPIRPGDQLASSPASATVVHKRADLTAHPDKRAAAARRGTPTDHR